MLPFSERSGPAAASDLAGYPVMLLSGVDLVLSFQRFAAQASDADPGSAATLLFEPLVFFKRAAAASPVPGLNR